MMLLRRQFLQLAAAATYPAMSRIAQAQNYPARPVRLIVGVVAGGGSDLIARLIGQWLSEHFGQQFVIENRPGASTNMATEAVVNEAPDGYTLLLVESANAINATLYQKLNFNFIRDIAPVASIARMPNVMLVHPSFPANTVAEFISYAKANPGMINMGSSGSGSPNHMSGELFRAMEGVNITQVFYRGNAPAMSDLLGGQIQLVFATTAGAIEYIKAGRLRALAVTTTARSEVLPNVPPMGEFLPGYEASTWWGVGVPRSTPAEIINMLNKAINAGLADAKLKARLSDLGGTMRPSSPAEFGEFIVEETEKWGKVVKFAGTRAD
jgi:tripartite-type tricarboxylate transporter receptor subunit TctC